MTENRAVTLVLAAAVIGLLLTGGAVARDAAFLDPGAVGGGAGDEAVKVEPKAEVDIGETSVGTTRRTTLFFVNESSAAVKVEKIDVNNDANVNAEITADDCSKQGTIAPQSRCSVEISITPTGSGSWTVETLMTHNGPGRIARAKISGKTAGGGSESEKHENGLAVTAKEANPVNFGEVALNAKAVRSALMVNDSPEPITLYSIDVIEANNGLELLDQGCAVDMELKPGESCPVTLVWTPTQPTQISTDLIIRHSGRLGFAVIPIRGTIAGLEANAAGATTTGTEKSAKSTSLLPPPPTADELDKAAAGKIAQLPASALPALASGKLCLIGTVGNRAVMLMTDGKTKIVSVGDEFPAEDGKTAKVSEIDPKYVKLMIDGKLKELDLEASQELMNKAAADAALKDTTAKSTTSTKGSSSTPVSTGSGASKTSYSSSGASR